MKSILLFVLLAFALCGCAALQSQETAVKNAFAAGNCVTVGVGPVSATLNGVTVGKTGDSVSLCPPAVTVVVSPAASAPAAAK